MRFSDPQQGDTHWIKPFAIRKRKKTALHQHPYLIPLAPMAVAIVRQIRTYHEHELGNAAYGVDERERGRGQSVLGGAISRP
jgi:hypothetical protein